MSSLDEPPSSNLPSHQTELIGNLGQYSKQSALRRAGMKTSVMEGSFSVAHITLTGPAFLTGYLLLNGATDLQLTFMLSIPYFLMVFQVAAAYLTTRIGSRKGLCSLGVFGCRGVHAIMALLPFLPGLSNSSRLWAIFGLLMFSNLTFMLLANTWWLWMADLVPEPIRGRYFGFKSGISLALGTFWSLAGGAMMDYYRGQGQAAHGFCVIFCLGSAFALIGLLFLRRQYEPPMQVDPAPSLRVVFGILKNRNFRRATLFLFVWNFGVGLMTALSARHMLGHMGMSFKQVMLYPVIVNLIGFAFARQWGRLMDTVGVRTTLLVCGGAAGFVPILWLFTGPGVMWPIWIDAVATGLFMTGMNIAAVNLPLVVTPQRHRLYYLAVFATITGLGVGLASLLAGQVAMMTHGMEWHFRGFSHSFINFHAIFAISALIRLGSLVLLWKYQDERGRSVSEAWARIGGYIAYPFAKRRRLALAVSYTATTKG